MNGSFKGDSEQSSRAWRTFIHAALRFLDDRFDRNTPMSKRFSNVTEVLLQFILLSLSFQINPVFINMILLRLYMRL